MTEVSSAAGTIAYQYDERGNLLSVTNHNGDVVSYTYDQYGNKISMTYPDGRTVSYTYDAMNRMTSVVGLDGETTTYSYDPAGRRVRTASGTLTTEYTYDSVGNLIRQETSGASEIAFSYSHNKNGYITGEKRTENGQTTDSAYAYDALGQLTAFTQSTGYGERYAYDAAGNMLQKVITGTDGKATALSMQYNAGNQLLSMTVGQESIAYAYDANGSMIRKTLTSAQYGTLTDTYTYDALDMLTGYAGYDGYTQQFTYDANGMQQTKREKGNAVRATLEELLRGSVAGLPEIIEPADAVEEGYAWAATEYLYDVTQEYYQVIRETRADNSGSTATAYAYGLERVAAYTADSKTTYVYDGRGSVVQTMTAPIPGATAFSSLPDVSVKVQSFTYTAYGEQMGAVKSSGFTYNAEAFDAATGMLNLRARQYEPCLQRFSQLDDFFHINRFVYSINSPIQYRDRNGLEEEDVSFAEMMYEDEIRRINEMTLDDINKLSLQDYNNMSEQVFTILAQRISILLEEEQNSSTPALSLDKLVSFVDDNNSKNRTESKEQLSEKYPEYYEKLTELTIQGNGKDPNICAIFVAYAYHASGMNIPAIIRKERTVGLDAFFQGINEKNKEGKEYPYQGLKPDEIMLTMTITDGKYVSADRKMEILADNNVIYYGCAIGMAVNTDKTQIGHWVLSTGRNKQGELVYTGESNPRYNEPITTYYDQRKNNGQVPYMRIVVPKFDIVQQQEQSNIKKLVIPYAKSTIQGSLTLLKQSITNPLKAVTESQNAWKKAANQTNPQILKPISLKSQKVTGGTKNAKQAIAFSGYFNYIN